MKTKSHRISLVLASAIFSLLSASAFAQVAAPPDKPAVPATQPGGATLNSPEFSSWDDIKNLTHEQKAEFAVGLHRLELKLDKQISDLKEKRTKMKGENTEWDFAMRNLEIARDYLTSVGAETEKASAEFWRDKKEKLGRAWKSTQDGLDRVNATTTQ